MNGLNPFLQVVTPDGYKKCHQVIQKASIILKVVVVVLNPVSNGIQNPKTVMVNIQDIHMLYMKQKLFLLRNSSVTLHYNTMAQATSDILKLYHIKNSHVHTYVALVIFLTANGAQRGHVSYVLGCHWILLMHRALSRSAPIYNDSIFDTSRKSLNSIF